jgi:DNA (cytosine-5)-methyltransferase 1
LDTKIDNISNPDIGEGDTRNEQEPRKEAYEKSLSNNRIDILTGGFPCQPFSQAGRRKGTDDDRYLWPEMLRVIREFKPTWVIAENVRGLLTLQQGVVFEQVCLDLEASDYEVQAFIIPAVAVNAPHRRDRVWFVAHRKSGESGEQAEWERRKDIGGGDKENIADSDIGGIQRHEREGSEERTTSRGSCSWDRNWIEVAAELCGLDDGLRERMVRLSDGEKISYSKWRNQSLKAFGNAIVPEVAIQILKSIKYAENL